MVGETNVGTKLRWGVLSTAKIGREKVIPAIGRSALGRVDALASRDLNNGLSVARSLGIARAYGSYEELLADPEIDAVYNPLPNHLHVDWTLAALKAGKHVLCEKPVGMSAADAERLRAASGHLVLAEAFMVRQHPQWLRARQLVREGRIGALSAMQIFFSYVNRDAQNIRNRVETGGGAILDIGCYAVVAGRFFFEAEPVRAVALVERDAAFGTDRLASAIIDFGAGRHLTFTVSTQLAPHQRVTLAGPMGRIEMPIPFNAPQGEATRLLLDDGSGLGGISTVEEGISPSDQYAEQADAFARAVMGETPLPYGLDDAVANMRVLDALFQSEKTGTWVGIAL